MELLLQLTIQALVVGSIYSLASMGMTIVFGLQKILNFAHGPLMVFSMYLFYGFWILAGKDPFFSAGSSLLITLITGFFLFKYLISPVQRAGSLATLVMTLGAATCIEAVCQLIFGAQVLVINSTLSQSIQIFSFFTTPIELILIAFGIFSITTAGVLLSYTSIGRAFRASSENGDAAQASGIESDTLSRNGFLATLLLSSMAAILISMQKNIEPSLGFFLTIKAFAAMILGGMGSVWGAIVGAYILGVLEVFSVGLTYGDWQLPASYKDCFAYAAVILFVLFKPAGLLLKGRRAV